MSESRHRPDSTGRYKTQDQAILDLVAKGEKELADKREARAKARAIRMLQLSQREEEEGSDSEGRTSRPGTPRPAPARTPTRLEPTLRTDSPSPSLQEQFNDLEKRFKEVSVTNASLTNEKERLRYQGDILRDKVVDLENTNQELKEELKMKARMASQQTLALERFLSDMEGLRQLIAYRDQFIESKGLVLPDPYAIEENGEVVQPDEDMNELRSSAFVQDLEDEVARLKVERQFLQDQLKHLKNENGSLREAVGDLPSTLLNGKDFKDRIREYVKKVQDYKSKWQVTEGEKSRLEAKVQRDEHTVKRLKQQVDDMEKLEDELKTKNRKLNRELRQAQNEISQLQEDKEHLQKRIDTLKRRKLET